MGQERSRTRRPGGYVTARVLARAPHELRQPLQAAMLHVQIMAGCPEAARRRETAELVEALLAGMHGMIDALARLARGEISAAEPAPALPLAPLLERVTGALAPADRERVSVVVDADAGSPLFVRGTAVCLEPMWSALLANALRLASGAPVLLEVRGGRRWHAIRTSWEGPPLGAGDIDALFVTGAREPAAVAPGFGLVAALAEASGGRLALASRGGGRQAAVVRLPAAAGTGEVSR